MSILYLIPTPIDDTSSLSKEAYELIMSKLDKAIICVEEMKEGRRRWLRFGLPREIIENFVLYNEHTRDKLKFDLLEKLKKKKDIILMSDCGLPAFCDPGADLVSLCHDHNIKVTSSPYPNSISLALALSGMYHDRFVFEGFIPLKNPERNQVLKKALGSSETTIIMDTPYRLKSLLEQMNEINPNKTICLCLDLNQESEEVLRGTVKKINEKMVKSKREFVIVIGKAL